MKKILFAAFAAATIGLAGYNVIESIQTTELSDLALKNIEALANDENNSSSDTQCPDYNYVPDHYLEVVLGSVTVTSDNDGYIHIGNYIQGGYKRNKEYQIAVEIKNCSGEQKGSCCDQREVKITLI